MIRVLLADDHKIVRDGLRRILAATADIEVAAEAADGDQALALVKASDYDIVVMDLSMPGLAGLDLLKRLRLERPKLKLLVLSMHGEQQYAARALKAGAAGYLNKDSAAEQLVGAIRKIAAGGVHIGEAAAASLVAGETRPHGALSDREFEVLRLLVEGKTPTAVAEQLHLSVKTVSTHKTRILEKLGLSSTADLVRYALENKLFRMLKVFLVEDSEILRTRLEAMLASIPGASLAGHAADAESATRGILAAAPDAVVLDVQLARGSGFEVLRAVRASAPGIRFYVLTNFANDAYRQTAERLGASGFFDKSNEFHSLRGALTALAAAPQ